ncbi:MAG: hypothetical protein E6L00_01025 [Thaumarchaeota archaeon]|nr:MAG: hypothetical protein E6L00_01025 [Nitrososphaerota archaeon]
MNLDKEQLRKALVSLSVERTLLKIGKPVYDKVVKQLSREYDCYLPDCYEYPEYLNKVLKKIFGNSYIPIVEAIKNELDDQLMEKPIEIFISAISE